MIRLHYVRVLSAIWSDGEELSRRVCIGRQGISINRHDKWEKLIRVGCGSKERW